MEALMRAQRSRHLEETHAVDELGDVDWLRAAGAAGQRHGPALAYWRLVELGDKHALPAAFQGALALALRLELTKPMQTATTVLRYLLNPTCRPCSGRGYAVAPGSPYLTAVACPKCEGTGKRPPRWGAASVALHDALVDAQRVAAADILRRMR